MLSARGSDVSKVRPVLHEIRRVCIVAFLLPISWKVRIGNRLASPAPTIAGVRTASVSAARKFVEVEPDIARAWTLPAQLYWDAAAFAAEKEKVFARTWQVVGHVHQVANPGDYFTTDLVGEPLLIVRGADGQLRGFYNVCRHRAGPAAEGCGSRKLFRCGYHGWTYDLDGTLISATEIEGVKGFRPEDFALVPVRTEEWFNLVFVNLDPQAPALRQVLGELPAQAGRFPFASMKLFERRTYDMKCNWKTYVDNYLEGYHLPSVHPGLNRELDYNAYVVEPHMPRLDGP